MGTKGLVAKVQSDGEGPKPKHASSVPLKPRAPPPRSFWHIEPGHPARTPSSGVLARVSMWDADLEEEVEMEVRGPGLRPWKGTGERLSAEMKHSKGRGH